MFLLDGSYDKDTESFFSTFIAVALDSFCVGWVSIGASHVNKLLSPGIINRFSFALEIWPGWSTDNWSLIPFKS